MKMQKTPVLILASAALVGALVLAGCGGSQGTSESSNASSSATSSTATTQTTNNSSTDSSATTKSTTTDSTSATSSSNASNTTTSNTNSSNTNASNTSTSNTSEYIGNDAAKAAALAHAGVDEASCTEMKVNLDMDDAIIHYDVEFKSGGMEYDYDIDPVTGDVLSASSEIDD